MTANILTKACPFNIKMLSNHMLTIKVDFSAILLILIVWFQGSELFNQQNNKLLAVKIEN